MSEDQAAVDVVRGEMQPWSDYSGRRGATGGPVVRALLDDVLPGAGRALVLGPHGAELVEAVAAGSTEATVLVRSVSDATALSQEFGDRVRVVAGALDGLAGAGLPPYDVVVAADGLDRVLGYDSDDLDWAGRLDALAAVMSPEAVLVLACENEFSLTNLLDRRLADQRHGDDEWRPLRDDPSRPVSVGQLVAELARVGFGAARTYANFAVQETPYALICAEIAAAARPGELPTRVATDALEASAAAVPLLAPVAEGAGSAARAGLLGATAPGWIAVCGPAGHALYAQTPGHPAVLTADDSGTGWSVALSDADPTGTPGSAGLLFSAEVVPGFVPGGVTVETLLLRYAAAEDVPAFRALAARLGDWVRSQTSRVLPRWDDMVVDGDSFAFGSSGWVTAADEAEQDRLAAGWARFHDRMIGAHHRHPWPPWMVGDDLVSAWLAMSGVDASAQTPTTTPDTPPASVVQVARGKKLATALDAALAVPSDGSPTPDGRTVLADADRAGREIQELKGQIFGLERTIGFRDKALKTRETRIRALRAQVTKADLDRARLARSRAYALARLISKAAMIRKPRKFAGAAKRGLRRRVKAARRG